MSEPDKPWKILIRRDYQGESFRAGVTFQLGDGIPISAVAYLERDGTGGRLVVDMCKVLLEDAEFYTGLRPLDKGAPSEVAVMFGKLSETLDGLSELLRPQFISTVQLSPGEVVDVPVRSNCKTQTQTCYICDKCRAAE